MFNHVLIPLDDSGWADRVVRFARPLLAPGAQVHLVTVVERAGDMPTIEEHLDEALAHLDRLRGELAAGGTGVQTELVTGEPVERILDAVDRHGCDLVVMATHGRSGPVRWVKGSVAEKVARSSPVPVLVANAAALSSVHEVAPGRLLVPLDGTSEAANAVLPVVEQLAGDFHSEVLLLQIAEPTPPAAAAAGVTVAPVVALPPVQDLLQALEPHRQHLEDAGIHARSLVGYGPGPAEILDTAERHDVGLIVMATHGRRGLERWVFGSVAESVVRHGRRPVLVLRLQGVPARRS